MHGDLSRFVGCWLNAKAATSKIPEEAILKRNRPPTEPASDAIDSLQMIFKDGKRLLE
jgi:hypothetical protein